MEWEHAKTMLAVALLVCLFLVSVPFEQRYGDTMTAMAHNPGARFLAATALLYIASVDMMLGALAFLVIFLWIADIQLLSSFKGAEPPLRPQQTSDRK